MADDLISNKTDKKTWIYIGLAAAFLLMFLIGYGSAESTSSSSVLRVIVVTSSPLGEQRFMRLE